MVSPITTPTYCECTSLEQNPSIRFRQISLDDLVLSPNSSNTSPTSFGRISPDVDRRTPIELRMQAFCKNCFADILHLRK